jgi:hypothetical protein
MKQKQKHHSPETVSKILTLYQTGYSASEIRNRINSNITTQEVVSLIVETAAAKGTTAANAASALRIEEVALIERKLFAAMDLLKEMKPKGYDVSEHEKLVSQLQIEYSQYCV